MSGKVVPFKPKAEVDREKNEAKLQEAAESAYEMASSIAHEATSDIIQWLYEEESLGANPPTTADATLVYHAILSMMLRTHERHVPMQQIADEYLSGLMSGSDNDNSNK